MYKFGHSLGNYALAELSIRVVRLISIVIIARSLSPELLGLAALTLSIYELVRMLTNAGIGQQIILANDDELAATCNTAYRLFWKWCLSIAAIQIGIGLYLYFGSELADTAIMLMLLSMVYAIMPAGLVQIFLTMRAGRLAYTARLSAVQNIADQLLTIILVLIWPSAWAIILPKLLTAPIWLYGARKSIYWRPVPDAGYRPQSEFMKFSLGILGSEILNTARQHVDKPIMGAVAGLPALGIYYFAYGAGLGITMSFIGAMSLVMFSQLGAIQNSEKRIKQFHQFTILSFCLFIPFSLAQAVFAPIYVPIIFGQKWAEAANVVSILALGAVPLLLAASASTWLRLNKQTGHEMLMMGLAGGCAIGGLYIGAATSLNFAAMGYVLGLSIILIPCSIFIIAQSRAQQKSLNYKEAAI
ncbi:hypothetical protein LPB140_01150 [Sphingorhabdus lutea]|uniref:Polysaccharide biosynthesis protein n=1 Tax=Sphingorhabdus lutea TaxID=1913578 RepID=A0A1L3JE99_9SPHN|nr:hypothetical protein LPB140_01150 [Sphingorhabdus lutea]